MALFIRGNNIPYCYTTVVKKVCKDGKDVKDERGSNTKEILNLFVEIRDPTKPIPDDFYWSGEKLKIYSKQFLSKDKQGFVYTYGNRLREHFDGIDQIQGAIKRLNNCEESRRATSVTWDPTIDPFIEDVPCMILVDFKIREGKLHTTGVWRSHDLYGAWLPNAVGLTELAKYVAEKTNVDVGPLVIHSISAHIYEVNFDDVKGLK